MGIYGWDDFYESTRSHLLYNPIKCFSALPVCISVPKHCYQLNFAMSHDLSKQWLQQYDDTVTFWWVTNSNDNSLHSSVVPQGSPATIKLVVKCFFSTTQAVKQWHFLSRSFSLILNSFMKFHTFFEHKTLNMIISTKYLLIVDHICQCSLR